jgi:hypothetical protein
VASQMQEGLQGCRGLLALVVAIAALLGVQGLGAAPAQALLTDTNDCPVCEDSTGGAPAGDDGGASANDSGGRPDAAPSPGDGSDHLADQPGTSSDTANTVYVAQPIDPMALTDPSKDPDPLAIPAFDPFRIAPSGTVSWSSPLGKCNLLVAHIVHTEELVDWFQDKLDIANNGLDKKSTSAADRRQLRELGDYFDSRVENKRRDLRSYRKSYAGSNCDSVYASAAGF